MENIIMKKKIMIGITAVVIVMIGSVCLCEWFLSGTGNTYYYTQIDNNKIEQGDLNGGVINFHGGMSYSYTLLAYNENGGKKDITFGTSRELKEGAFIRLTVKPVRGVLEWNEVQYDELPMAVQRNYTEPKNE
jgi:uncharacterized protein (TIGR01655 family)